MSTLTSHLVTRDPDAAAAWYGSVLGGTYGAVHVAVEDADVAWSRALQAGATVFEPLHDAFWGERTGQFIDPFGHRWAVDQHIRDVPHDEIVRLAAAAFSGGSS
jgi:PhnB protein